MSKTETIFCQRGHVGSILLNRPHVLNALSSGQFAAISAMLTQWSQQADVGSVIIEGAGGKAFCAGGDLRAVWDARRDGCIENSIALFRDEYRLDYQIATLNKPYIALIDGIVMGGGAGISMNGAFRVVTERTLFAMPETAIGFFPDVGGSHFLNRCPGQIGLYLGLTGARIGSADMLWAGLATHVVRSVDLDALKIELQHCAPGPDCVKRVQAILDRYHCMPDRGVGAPLSLVAAAIDQCFSAPDPRQILLAVRQQQAQWAVDAVKALASASPTSLWLTHRQIKGARGMDLAQALKREFGMAVACLHQHDFYEGIRAVVIDKDRAPKWHLSDLDQVAPDTMTAYFGTAAFAQGVHDLSLP